MAFTIPNAIDYGVSIASLEQAEPDKLDFTTLGDRRSGVISGGAVTSVAVASGAYVAVAVASSEVTIAGNYGSIAGATLTIATAPGSGTRFDLICAQYTSPSTYEYVVVAGTSSTSNPVFPALTSMQIPLYAVVVKAGLATGTLANLVVDKRTLIGSPVFKYGSATPTGGVTGDLYYRTGSSPASGQSTLWFNNAGTWENLAKYTYPPATTATANTLVQRDASGNFSAGTITAALVGNASTVTNGVYNDGTTYGINISGSAAKWTTARTITFTGNATGSLSLDGSSNQSVALTLDPAVPTAKAIAIGTTTTGGAGSSAAVSVTQNASTATLSFTIPQGIKGDKGETGNQGPQGPSGPQGAASTVAGPKGDTGSTGAAGAAGPSGPAGPTNVAAGYLTNSVNVDPLGGPYIGWSSGSAWWAVSGTLSTGTLVFGGTRTTTSPANMRVISGGEVATVTSLRKYKEQINSFTNGLNIINSLTPRTFKAIPQESDGVIEKLEYENSIHHGFIVDEILEVQPQLIEFDISNDKIVPKMWKTNDVISILVQAVQELSAKVEALEAQ